MISTTIDYQHLTKAGFDSKNCGISGIKILQQEQNGKIKVYDTSSSAPLYFDQATRGAIETITVEFAPFIQGKELLSKADDLVKDVLKDNYKPEPCTICTYDKDGKIDTQKTINDVFIQEVQLFVNRKNNSKDEQGYIRIKFTLQGLRSDK